MQLHRQSRTEGKPNLLRDQRFRWLIFAWFSAIMGQQIALTAMPWLALQLGGDGLSLGMMIAAMELPRAVFIIIGGAVVDRYSPHFIFKCSLFACTALMIILGVAILSGRLQLPQLYLFAAAIGIVGAFSGPSAAALLPETVAPERLQSANSFFMGVNQASLFIGPILAGLLIALPNFYPSSLPIAQTSNDASAGLGLVFILCAMCFMTAGFGLTRMAANRDRKTARNQSPSTILRSIVQGAKWAWSDVTLRSLFAYWAAIAFLTSGPIQIGLPLLVKHQMQLGADHYGMLISSQGAGNLVGMALMGLLPQRVLGRLGLMVFCIDGIVGIIIISLGLAHYFATSAILMFFIGLFSGLVQVRLIVWIQSRIPVHMRGRVMSFQMFTMAILTPLSGSLAGFFISVTSSRNLYIGVGLCLMAIALFALSNRNLRNIKGIGSSEKIHEIA